MKLERGCTYYLAKANSCELAGMPVILCKLDLNKGAKISDANGRGVYYVQPEQLRARPEK